MSSLRETAVYFHANVIHGHHIYKTIWTPTIGEVLQVSKEPTNANERRAVAVLTSVETVVGHVPREISKIFWHFINHGGTITSEVSGPRKHGKRAEVPCQYKLLGPEKLDRKAKLLQMK